MNIFSNKIGVASVLGSSVLSVTPLMAQKQSQPNVLMVVVDDWGANDLSFSGSKFYETPHIDQLTKEATTFNQAYVAYPRSVPSRFSLWTGMHAARPQAPKMGVSDDREVNRETFCMAEGFKAADYQTFFIGKWHLNSKDCTPDDKGFDINIGGGKAGAPGTYFAPFNKPGGGKEKPIEGMDDANEGEYLTDYMTRKMVDYIDGKHQKPFFAVCSYYAVHTPLEAKPEIIEKYRNKRAKMNLQDDPMMNEEAGVRKTQQDDPVYAAMIESVDTGVGEMIAALKRNNLYDNTVIVIISDHGGLSNRGQNKRQLATTNAPLKAGKGHLYEGGVRVPLLVRLPAQKSGIKSNTPVVSLDILPTLSQICNFPIAKNAVIDGKSFAGELKGKSQKELLNRSLFWHKATERPGSTGDYVSSSIRQGDYKLIDFYAQNRIELYNLKNDPGEKVNLAESDPKKAQEMLAALKQWKSEVKAYDGNPGAVKDKKSGKQQNKQGNKRNKNKKNRQQLDD